MNKVLKRAATFLALALVLLAVLPGSKVKAADNGVLHTKAQVSGKDDSQKVTYTVTLDKTAVSDGRVAVVYDSNVLVLKKDTEGIKFTETDVNRDYKNGEEAGIAVAFVNDSAKKVGGTLVSLTFEVKKNLENQDTVIKTEVFGINNEDTEVVAASSLEDTVTVGRAKLQAPTLNSLNQTLLGVNVCWKKDKNAEGYVILRSTSKDGKYSQIASTNISSYWDVLLKNNTTYYYKVKSYSGKGAARVYSEESNVLSIKVKKFLGLFG